MATVVGTLVVDLVARTASFDGPLDSSTGKAKKAGKEIPEAFNKMDLGEARGGLMLIDDLLGVHIPRHATAFASQIPGLMQVASFVMPAAAIGAIGIGIFEATEKLKKYREEMEKVKQETLDTVIAFQKHGEALQISNLRLQDQISVLQKRLPQNAVVIAAIEGKHAVDELIASFQKAIDKESELLQKQTQGIWSRLMNGDTGQNSIIEKAQVFKAKIDDLTQEMQTSAALGHKKEADDYRDKLSTQISDFRLFLATQRDELANAKKLTKDSLMQDSISMGPNGEQLLNAAISAAAAEKQVNEQYADRQRILNDLVILSQSYGQQQKEIATNTALHETEAVVSAQQKILELRNKVGQEIRRIADGIAQHQTESSSRLREYLINDIERVNRAKIKAIDEEISFYDRSAANILRINTLTREQSDQDAVQGQRMAVATGRMTEQAAVQQALIALDKNRKQEMDEIIARINTQFDEMERLKALTSGGKNGTDDEKAQYHKSVLAYQEMQAQKLEIARKFTAQENQLRLQAANNESSQWRKMALEFAQVQTRMSQLGRQTLEQMNSSVAAFVVTGQGGFRQLAIGAIEEIVKIGLQWIESKLLMIAFGKVAGAQEVITQAAIAGAGGVASMAAAPFPIDLTAPAFGAAMMGDALSYLGMLSAEKGAILPSREMLVHTHPEEMILPRNVSNFILNAASSASGDGGGVVHHHHHIFAPQVSAMDTRGMREALKPLHEEFKNDFKRELRRMNL
jgi:lambda family phage tail tape measure protein